MRRLITIRRILHTRQHWCTILLGARLASLAIAVTSAATTAAAATASTAFAFFTLIDWLCFKRGSRLLLLARLLWLRRKFMSGLNRCCGVSYLVVTRLSAFRAIAFGAFATRPAILALLTGLSLRAIFALTALAFAIATSTIITASAIASLAGWLCRYRRLRRWLRRRCRL